MTPAAVAVAGIGRTAYTRSSGRTTQGMAAEACRAALADAGLTAADVDGIGTYGVNDTAAAVGVAAAIGVDEVGWAVDLFGGGNAVTTLVAAAGDALRAGRCHAAVVYRSLNGRSGQRFGEAPEVLGAITPDAPFDLPHGYVLPPQYMAMWARRHQHVHGSTGEDLGRIAVTQRAHAAANPHAVAREPLTLEGYLAGRWIDEPLRVYDCAFEVDGAVALVLTTSERARDLRRPPVVVAGSAESHGHGGSWDQWPDLTSMFSATVAPRLLARTGMTVGDVDVACIYDCFTYTVMAVLEDFGFADRGGVGAFFAEGRATYGGDVVVNPHGGLLSEGYIHGLNSHFEAVLQLRRAAGERQVPGAEVALVTAGSGPYGGGVIYTVDR
jgi:acetyl-CoA acetyltransferase